MKVSLESSVSTDRRSFCCKCVCKQTMVASIDIITAQETLLRNFFNDPGLSLNEGLFILCQRFLKQDRM